MDHPDTKAPPAPPDHDIPEGLEADLASLRTDERPAEDDPYHRDSIEAQKVFDLAVAAASAGNEDEAVRRFLTAAKLAEGAHEWYLAALAFQRVGDFLINPKPPVDLERAFRMYRRAIDAYTRCGLADDARELSYYLLRLQLLRGRQLKLPWHRRAELWIFWLVAGFGYRPLRVIGLAATIVIAFAFVYWAGGGVTAVGSQDPAGLWDCLYFSGVTFATVGYGDYLPTARMRPVAMIEGMVGALTMGFFVAVLANRLRR